VTITNREVIEEFKQAQGQSGSQLGGGPGAADEDAAGGSSGTGGYGNAQNQSLHQGQNGGPDDRPDKPVTRELSRGERFDLEQGGGRGVDSLDADDDVDEDVQPLQGRAQGAAGDDGAAGEAGRH
jgi:hypothetical protein